MKNCIVLLFLINLLYSQTIKGVLGYSFSERLTQGDIVTSCDEDIELGEEVICDHFYEQLSKIDTSIIPLDSLKLLGTPMTQKLFNIILEKRFEDKDVAVLAFNDVKTALEYKYGTFELQSSSGEMRIYQKEIGKVNIRLIRSFDGSCVTLSYFDTSLSALLHKESSVFEKQRIQGISKNL